MASSKKAANSAMPSRPSPLQSKRRKMASRSSGPNSGPSIAMALCHSLRVRQPSPFRSKSMKDPRTVWPLSLNLCPMSATFASKAMSAPAFTSCKAWQNSIKSTPPLPFLSKRAKQASRSEAVRSGWKAAMTRSNSKRESVPLPSLSRHEKSSMGARPARTMELAMRAMTVSARPRRGNPSAVAKVRVGRDSTGKHRLRARCPSKTAANSRIFNFPSPLVSKRLKMGHKASGVATAW
mmetsp:Transcript_130746/g.279641  ORF Transcript_130746/g.279641 Transcript_130746/m.279641 type:complete len:237 (-) Transcript_130746:265-975(-)